MTPGGAADGHFDPGISAQVSGRQRKHHGEAVC